MKQRWESPRLVSYVRVGRMPREGVVAMQRKYGADLPVIIDLHCSYKAENGVRWEFTYVLNQRSSSTDYLLMQKEVVGA